MNKNIIRFGLLGLMVFAPLVFLVLWMGIYPTPFLDVMHVSVDHLMGQVEKGLAAAQMGPVLAGR